MVLCLVHSELSEYLICARPYARLYKRHTKNWTSICENLLCARHSAMNFPNNNSCDLSKINFILLMSKLRLIEDKKPVQGSYPQDSSCGWQTKLTTTKQFTYMTC